MAGRVPLWNPQVRKGFAYLISDRPEEVAYVRTKAAPVRGSRRRTSGCRGDSAGCRLRSGGCWLRLFVGPFRRANRIGWSPELLALSDGRNDPPASAAPRKRPTTHIPGICLPSFVATSSEERPTPPNAGGAFRSCTAEPPRTRTDVSGARNAAASSAVESFRGVERKDRKMSDRDER